MAKSKCTRKRGCSNLATFNRQRLASSNGTINFYKAMKEEKFDNQTAPSVALTSNPNFIIGVFRNGARLESILDYTIALNVITFVEPLVNDNIVVIYF